MEAVAQINEEQQQLTRTILNSSVTGSEREDQVRDNVCGIRRS